MRNDRNRKAFTIVEMVIVIAVIAVLAAVMIPTISGVIQMANVSADKQFAASLNIQLALWEVDNGEIASESDLRDAINDLYGELAEDGDYYAIMTTKSAKGGYYYWYDYNNGAVFVATPEGVPEELAKFGGASVAKRQQEDEMKPTLMFLSSRTDKSAPTSAISLANGQRRGFADNVRASLRFGLVDGAYLMGNKVEDGAPTDVLGLITKFEDMVDGGDYEDTIKAMYELQAAFEDDHPNKAAIDALVAKAEKTAIFNGHDFFLPYNENAEGESGEGYEIWTPVTAVIDEVTTHEVKIYQYKNEEVPDTSREDAIPVKGGEFQVPGSINTLKALSGLLKMPGNQTGEVKMQLDATFEQLTSMATPDDADYVIELPDGSQYIIVGADIYNWPRVDENDIPAFSGLEFANQESLEVKIEYNNSGDRGSDDDYYYIGQGETVGTLYLAWDFDSAKLFLANGVPASMVEWTVSENALIEVNRGVITLVDGATPDVLKSTATVTATLKGDATKTDSIKIQLVFPLEVEWSIENTITKNDTKVELNYTGSADFGITEDNVVYIANADYYVKLNNEPAVSITAGEGTLFSITDKKLVLKPENIEGNSQILTVTYGDYVTQTYTVTAKDNSSVGLKKNQITGTVTMGDYLFRVGNGNAFALGKLFSAVEAGKAVDVKSVNIYDASKSTGTNNRVAIATSDSGFTATYTAGSDWASGTIKFSGTGVAIIEVVTAKGSVELAVEVVNGKNVFAAGDFSGATNYVVLNDITWGTANKTAINGTLYGNGFAINATAFTNATTNSNNALFYLNGGTIDNLVINGPVYPELIYQNEVSSSKPYYVAGIYTTGNATITNSYISGFRSPVMANGISLYLENTTLIGGNYANLWLQTGSLTLRDVTTVQQPTTTTIGSGTVLGAGIIADSGINASNVTIIGDLTQYNWVTKDQVSAHMDSNVSSLIDKFFNNTTITQTVNGTKYINTGIVFQSTTGTVNNASQTSGHGYTTETVSGSLMGVSFTGKVYTRTTTSGTVTSIPTYGGYAPNAQSVIKPAFKHNLTLTNGEVRYSIDIPKGETATLDASGYTVSKYSGQSIAVNITCPGATINGKKITFSKVGAYTLTYTVEDNTFYNADGSKQAKNNVDTYTVTVVVSNSNHPNAVINLGGLTKETKWVESGLVDKDYSAYFEVLGGLVITDYNEDGTPFTVTISASNLNGLTVEASNSEVTGTSVDGTKYWMYDTKADDNKEDKSVTFTYTYKGKNGNTVTATSTAFTLKASTSSSGGGCVTPDTLVTLADGTQKEIQYVTYEDELLVWNFYEGKYETVPAAIIFDMGTDYFDVLTLVFDDGTIVKTINGHRFFDKTANAFALINTANVADFVGHEFVKVDGDSYETVKLVDYGIVNEYTTSYSIMSAYYYNFIVEGMLSDTFHKEDAPLFDCFQIGDNMMYDADQLKADIEKYGLYTYEDFADYLTYEQFAALNVQYLRIAVEKGQFTYEGILDLINTYLQG